MSENPPAGGFGPAMPFRPLGLADLFSSTFSLLGSNPRLFLAMPILPMLILSALGAAEAHASEFGYSAQTPALATLPAVLSLITALAALLVGSLLSLLVLLAASQAVIGRRLSIRAALARSSQRLLPMMGTALLIGFITAMIGFALILVGLLLLIPLALTDGADTWLSDPRPDPSVVLATAVGLLLFGLVMLLVQLPFVYAPIVCALEDCGPAASIGRSFTLIRGSFWRTFGRLLLGGAVMSALLVFLLLLSVLAVAPFTYAASETVFGWLIMLVLTLLLAPALSFMLVFQFLMYADERMRAEGLGPALERAYAEEMVRRI